MKLGSVQVVGWLSFGRGVGLLFLWRNETRIRTWQSKNGKGRGHSLTGPVFRSTFSRIYSLQYNAGELMMTEVEVSKDSKINMKSLDLKALSEIRSEIGRESFSFHERKEGGGSFIATDVEISCVSVKSKQSESSDGRGSDCPLYLLSLSNQEKEANLLLSPYQLLCFARDVLDEVDPRRANNP